MRSRIPSVRCLFVVLSSIVVVSCSPPAVTGDAGSDVRDVATGDAPGDMVSIDAPSDGTSMCANDTDCDDGTFCNGVEQCMPMGTGADARGCVAANPATPCAAMMLCDESMRRCQTSCDTTGDADGDGHR